MALVAALIIGVVGGCGDEEPSREAAPPRPAESRAEVTRLARDYVEAFNRRDGERVCDLWMPQLRDWLDRAFRLASDRGYDCAKIIEAYIGYVEDNPQTPWLRARIVRLGRVEVAGGRASVALTLRHTSESAPDEQKHDVLHFVRHDGDWKLGKQGRILFEAFNAYNPPEGVLEPPADAKLLDRPAELPEPSFECRGRPETLTDPAGDVAWYDESSDSRSPTDAPWLDVRRATARRQGGDACVVIELGAPPRPASSYQWAFEEPSRRPPAGSFYPRRVGLRIDGVGRAHILGRAELKGATAAATAPPRVGVRGNELHIALTKPIAGWRGWSVYVRSLQEEEPILADPVRGDDRAPDQ
jgi:hypothetical protein